MCPTRQLANTKPGEPRESTLSQVPTRERGFPALFGPVVGDSKETTREQSGAAELGRETLWTSERYSR